MAVGIIGPTVIAIGLACVSFWVFHRSGCLRRRKISKAETDSDDDVEKKSDDGNLTIVSTQSSRLQTDGSDKQPEPEADVQTLDVEVVVVEDEEITPPSTVRVASTVLESTSSTSARRFIDAASGMAGLTASEQLSPRMTEAVALSVDQVPPIEEMVTYTTVIDQEGAIENQPVVVALQTLRGSFALSNAAPASLRSSNRKLSVDRTMASTHRDDLTEERRHDRPCMESPGREVKRVSSSGKDVSMARRQPGAATRAVWGQNSSGVLEAKKVRRKMSPALSGGARRPKRTCLADILDSKGDRLETYRNPEASLSSMGTASMSASSSSSTPGTPGYSPGQSVNHRRANAYGNWSKARRNHRNDRMSSARIPPMLEQWWVEPPTIQEGVRDLIGGLRRSLMRQQV